MLICCSERVVKKVCQVGVHGQKGISAKITREEKESENMQEGKEKKWFTNLSMKKKKSQA